MREYFRGYTSCAFLHWRAICGLFWWTHEPYVPVLGDNMRDCFGGRISRVALHWDNMEYSKTNLGNLDVLGFCFFMFFSVRKFCVIKNYSYLCIVNLKNVRICIFLNLKNVGICMFLNLKNVILLYET